MYVTVFNIKKVQNVETIIKNGVVGPEALISFFLAK